MGLRSSPLAYTILPSSAGGLGLFQSTEYPNLFAKNILLDLLPFQILSRKDISRK